MRLQRKVDWPAWLALIANVPQLPGVYCVWRDSRPLYVGRAVNLFRRLRRHDKMPLFRQSGANAVTFLVIVDSCAAHYTERMVIFIQKPPLNREKYGSFLDYRNFWESPAATSECCW